MILSPARLAAAWLVLALSTLVEPCMAQPADPRLDPRDAARLLAEQGYSLFEGGKLDEALAYFVEANETYAAPSIELMIARTQMRRGKLATALRVYERIAREPLPPDVPPAFAEAKSAAQREGEALRPRVPTIEVTLSGENAATRVTATLDGRPLPVSTLMRPIYVDPGTHRLELRPDDGAARRFDLTVEEGGRETVALTLAPLQRAAVPPPEASDDDTMSLVIPGVVALSVGAIGLAMGIGAGVVALQKESELEERCPDGRCVPEDKAVADAAELNANLSYVGFALGGLGIASGITLVVLGVTLDDDASAQLKLGPTSVQARLSF